VTTDVDGEIRTGASPGTQRSAANRPCVGKPKPIARRRDVELPTVTRCSTTRFRQAIRLLERRDFTPRSSH
jgi:hypothetical protein